MCLHLQNYKKNHSRIVSVSYSLARVSTSPALLLTGIVPKRKPSTLLLWVLIGRWAARISSEKDQQINRHINLRKVLGTPARFTWDTRQNKQRSIGQCPGYSLPFTRADRKRHLCWDTWPSRRFSEISCDFSDVPLVLPS